MMMMMVIPLPHAGRIGKERRYWAVTRRHSRGIKKIGDVRACAVSSAGRPPSHVHHPDLQHMHCPIIMIMAKCGPKPNLGLRSNILTNYDPRFNQSCQMRAHVHHPRWPHPAHTRPHHHDYGETWVKSQT
jgi:hypothetical protein